MDRLNQGLLILHFIGLALGFSTSFANKVMIGVMAKAAPAERPVLARFLAPMSQIGRIGLGLLWATGVTLVFTKWGGFAGLPWQFHVKLTAVVLLTVAVAYMYRLEGLQAKGDTAAGARLETAGMLTTLLAIVAVIFAVLTFD